MIPSFRKLLSEPRSLRTRLSLNIALVVLLTVAVISVVSNVFINRQFERYIIERQKQQTESILSLVNQQYNAASKTWNAEYLHAVGMHALYDGYIVKIYGTGNEMLWDAELCDMSACRQMMRDISRKMQARFPNDQGAFTVNHYDLTQNGQAIATVSIRCFSPYFYSDDDFLFLDSLNLILAGSGLFSLLLAVAVGWLLARRLSNPIRITAERAKRMSTGDYAVRINEKNRISELDELTRSVNQLADSLGKQEALRKRLTADVAHELRTPLTNVATHIEAMIEGVWEPTPARLSSCHEEIGRISKLVSDLENLARMDSDNLKLDKTRVDLLELSQKTLSNFETEIAAKKLTASIDGNRLEVWADSSRIRQVLTNILSNAVKYTRPGGTIRVTLSESRDFALLAVEDDGIGIPPDELPFIFERFYRAEKSRNRLSGGSGIGLAVVKSIVTAHGGTAEAESRVNQGSRFQIVLPKTT